LLAVDITGSEALMAGGVMLTANAAVDASKLTKASRTLHPVQRISAN